MYKLRQSGSWKHSAIRSYCQLPGVIATGPTKKETLELMKEAIEFHLEGLKAERLSIPEPTTTAASVDVSV